MTILGTIRDKNLFGAWFQGDSWTAWLAFLSALFGLPMDEAAQAVYAQHTGRSNAPTAQFREGWLVVGRRGGKSLVAALVAVFIGCFRDHSMYLKPGEVGTVMVLAADRKQARVIMRYVVGFLEGVPMLADLVENKTKESIELSNKVVIEVHTSSFRTVRGYTLLAVIADEIAFWRSDDSANPDKEVLAALRPGLATIPGSLLLCLSSPYSRHGALWETYNRHFGKDSPILVWQADSKSMNPTLPDSVIAQAYEEDAAAASAEYGAEFRRDVESFISREAVEAVVVEGRLELPPLPDIGYTAFVDPSGGSNDSMTLAIGHQEGDRSILDLVRERKPPFSPESVVQEFAANLRRYSISTVYGDRYAGMWPRERFSVHGIQYETAEKNRSALYLEMLALINSQRCELLDHSNLISQLCALERRTGRGGKDSIDHSPGAHDDVVNAAAGVLVQIEVPAWELAPLDPNWREADRSQIWDSNTGRHVERPEPTAGFTATRRLYWNRTRTRLVQEGNAVATPGRAVEIPPAGTRTAAERRTHWQREVGMTKDWRAERVTFPVWRLTNRVVV